MSVEAEEEAEGANENARSACLLCHRGFLPKKPNQQYCRPSCRQKALRLRRKADSLPEHGRHPRVSRNRLWAQQQAGRLKAGVPALRRDAFLDARAAELEAEVEVQTWQKRLAQCRAKRQALESPPFRVRRELVRPGQQLPVNLDATHAAIASSTGSCAIVLFAQLPSGR